ncbi:MAG: hypothetical protein JSU70_17525 [Phycisphaerales bacterium]|nr:MAG: hypothetical protein JSU70_17525 [Phycisphaerales bacterium]
MGETAVIESETICEEDTQSLFPVKESTGRRDGAQIDRSDFGTAGPQAKAKTRWQTAFLIVTALLALTLIGGSVAGTFVHMDRQAMQDRLITARLAFHDQVNATAVRIDQLQQQLRSGQAQVTAQQATIETLRGRVSELSDRIVQLSQQDGSEPDENGK